MNETNETVFRKQWKVSLLGAPVVFLVGVAIALVIGLMGFVGAAGVIAAIAGMCAASMLFDGVMCLISPARITVTDETLVYRPGLSESHTLTRIQATQESWAVENECIAIRFDDGIAFALKNFNCRAIYDAMKANGWTGLPDWPSSSANQQNLEEPPSPSTTAGGE